MQWEMTERALAKDHSGFKGFGAKMKGHFDGFKDK